MGHYTVLILYGVVSFTGLIGRVKEKGFFFAQSPNCYGKSKFTPVPSSKGLPLSLLNSLDPNPGCATVHDYVFHVY